jgi:hypothetical protein
MRVTWTSLGAASPRVVVKKSASQCSFGSLQDIIATDGHHTVGAGAVRKTRRRTTPGQICPPQIRQQRNHLHQL